MTQQFTIEGDTAGIFSNWESQLPLVPGPTGKPEIHYYCTMLTHYQMTNFRLFQTERVCRR